MMINKGKLVYILILVFGLQGLVSCESNKREEIDVSDLPDPIIFSEHIQPIFDASCVQCHNGTTPPNLTTGNAYLEVVGGGYVDVENPANSKFYKAIDLGGSMYQYATDLDRAYILKWIETGADEN